MSRRKHRGRMTPQLLRSLLNSGSSKPAMAPATRKLGGILDKIFDPDANAARRSRDVLEEWQEAFSETLALFPEPMFDEAEDLFDVRVEIDGVFADGMIAGQCRTNAGDFNVFARHPGTNPPAGCSCPQSNGEFPCPHGLMFVDEIVEQLGEFHSSLAKRVRIGQFDVKKPDKAIFRYDQSATIRRLIDSLIPEKMATVIDEEDTSLPPVEASVEHRIAWDILIKHDQLQAVPVLQQAKKRGGGWTKGRKIALDSLGQHSHLFSDADQQVRDLIDIEVVRYRPTHVLDSIAVIDKLVGEPNVLLNGEPAEIRKFDPTLVIHRDESDCWLRVEGASPALSRFVFTDEHTVHLRTDLGIVEIGALTREQSKCLRAAIRLPRMPLSHEPDLVDALQKLSSIISVKLPESFAGKVVDDEYQPALLLRSRSDGSLDYGIRVRDSSGVLRKPGAGRMLRAGERDGQAVQIRRSTAREYQHQQSVAQRFGLSTKRSEGTIKDFETALNLIERLQATDAEVEILWDKTSEPPIRVLGAVSSKNVSVGISRKRDWFQLSGSCDFGSESVDLSDLLRGLQAAGVDSIRGDYVRLGDKGWAKISHDLRQQFQHLHDSLNQERGVLKFDATSAPAIRKLMAGQVQLKATRAWQDCLARLEQSEKLEPVLPAGLNAQLRDYQQDGYKWLRRLAEWGVGGILADDMGLGKTLQTLAVILDRAQEGPTLVIAPTSVGFNWVREAERFTPQLAVHLYRETERADFLQRVGPGSLVVCSYGLALRDAAALAEVEWGSLVLDEAQAIKNSRSKTSAAIAKIPAKWRVGLTGTPVENHLGELWSLFHVISPGVLGGWDQFRRRFAAPIEKENDEQRRMALRERLRPFILRRTKGQVLKDLPPRSEMNLYVELTAAERAMYDQVRLSAVGEIDAIAKLPDVQDQRFRILALLTRLRQLACSPKLVHENWKERSSKLVLLCETLQELRDEGHRVLVFSQFVQHLNLIREMLDQESISYEYLDGSTTPQARQQRVDSFQNGEASVFLISLKAGGTGLNLTAADYVIHMDPWWNPAVEDQATDRAHRIGQDKPVMVYRLVSQGTIEEEILKLHDNKRDLVAGVLEGAHTAGKLSTEDLMALLRR